MEVLIAGGAGSDAAEYAPMLEVITERGYTAGFVPLDWRDEATLDDWIEQFQRAIEGRDLRQTIFAGFSFGAVTALALAARTNPAGLWLLSLSPVFPPDDLASWPADLLPSPAQVTAFNRLDFDQLTGAIHCPTLLFLGSKENFATLPARVRTAHRQIRGSRLVIAEGAHHAPNQPPYLAAVRKAI